MRKTAAHSCLLSSALAVCIAAPASFAQAQILVGDFAGNRIGRFAWPSGLCVDHFVAAGISPLDGPQGMVYGPDGALFVCSRRNDQVLKYDGQTGQMESVFVAAGAGGLDGPIDLVFGPDGNLYVSSSNNDRILRYDGETGAFLDVFVEPGAGGLDLPHGLEFDPSGALIVASFLSDAVLRFDGTTGDFIDEFIPAGVMGLDAPHDVLRLDDGRYLVTGNDSDSIVARGPDGEVFTFVHAGATPLVNPAEIIVSPAGDLLVTYDNAGGGVLRFSLDGKYLGIYIDGDAGGLSGEVRSIIVKPEQSGAEGER